MTQPLVLAIEPDSRQAAIVKRIVREKVLADVTVVDSRDAALEAMRTTVPDVVLLSALLSPRDENELIAHLRTLEHAEHLQTHTIPQLASSIGPGDDDERPSKGLLSAFRRRKGSGKAPTGCDPDLFADEIRAYLQRASDKKREVRDTVAAGGVSPTVTRDTARPKRIEESEPAAAPAASSWASPFEWRPSTPSTFTSSSPTSSAPAAAAVAGPAPAASKPEPFVLPEPFVVPEPFVPPEPLTAEPVAEPASVLLEPEPLPIEPAPLLLEPEPLPIVPAPILLEPEPLPAAPTPVVASAPRAPLVMRAAREWWFEDPGEVRTTLEPASEVRAVLASLSVPETIAAIKYAEGCRIRRVRLKAA